MWDRVGMEGGVTDEKGFQEKGGGQDPLTPPPLDTPMQLPVHVRVGPICKIQLNLHEFL